MDKYISAFYIEEKMHPIENLINIVHSACNGASASNNISSQLSESFRRDIAFSFAVIAKELNVDIPDV